MKIRAALCLLLVLLSACAPPPLSEAWGRGLDVIMSKVIEPRRPPFEPQVSLQ